MHFYQMYIYLVMLAKALDIIEKLLEIKFKNKNIAEVLDMTVEEGCVFLKIYQIFIQNY